MSNFRLQEQTRLSIWCAGSSEKVYAAVSMARCPKCGKMVEVTARKHIKPHVENKTASAPARK
jgi:Zn finger protein HypA/HybF involved in hydrogenase expression